MPIGKFLLAIFCGRCLRFLAVSFLTIEFGPQFVHWFGAFFHHHFWWIALGAAAVAGLWLWLSRRKPRTATSRVS
jgi:membrane protein DedA with SNARE-associated domain